MADFYIVTIRRPNGGVDHKVFDAIPLSPAQAKTKALELAAEAGPGAIITYREVTETLANQVVTKK